MPTEPNWTYSPDGWILVKIEGTDPHYRVFGSWAGGFLDGDQWRLNSGVTGVVEDDDYYYFYGTSSSVYRCSKESYGRLTGYNTNVINGYCDKSQGTMMILNDMPEVMEIDWII